MNIQTSVPVIEYNDGEARDAYLAYIALLAHRKLDPALADNPAYQKLVDAAYAQFFCAFEVHQ